MRRDEVLKGSLPRAPEAIIHLEVKQHVPNPNAAEIAEFETVNVGGTREWLDWADRNGVRLFVFCSTIKVAAASDASLTDESPCQPDTAYGESKLHAENVVSTWATASKAGVRALILRPGVVYGPGNVANMWSFVDAICRGRFFFVGGSRNIKSMVSLRNFCAAVDHLLGLRTEARREVFNVVDRESYSVADLAKKIAVLLGKPPEFKSLPSSIAKGAALVGDAVFALTRRQFPLTSSRLKAFTENTAFSSAKLVESGFVHPQTTDEGLRELVEWYLKSKRQ
jgi:nucleoside-diphosphate-sugar epimerase